MKDIGLLRNRQNNNHQQELGRQSELSFDVLNPENIRQQNNVLNQQQQFEEALFERVHRNSVTKAMSSIFKDWKRSYSFKKLNNTSSCLICLVDFEKDEEVIELRCGKGHIFHRECIKSWANRKRTCPI